MSTVNTYTLEKWISAFKSQSNTISDFVTRLAISDGTTCTFLYDESILGKYRAELDNYKVSVELNSRQQHFYSYNPRLFAYDLYGVPEFWYLILYANELYSATDFHPSTVKFYKASVINLINTIRQIETDRKSANNQEMTSIVVNNTVINDDVLIDIL